MSAPAPQELGPAPVPRSGAIPEGLVAAAPVPVTAVGPVVPRIDITAKANSPADAGAIEMFGFVLVPLAAVPPAVGVEGHTPPKRTVAQTCFVVPLTRVAVIV